MEKDLQNIKYDKLMIPKIIDYRITSLCNLNCPFCFGTRIKNKMDLKSVFYFFEEMSRYGLEKVVITGGEPTLSPDFKDIVIGLRKIGLKLYLSTNGYFLNNVTLDNQFILDNFDCIALPLEANDEHIHNCMRVSKINHYENIKSALNYIRQNSDIQIKLETVVTQINYDYVEYILDRLEVLPDRWKLYQLCKSESNNFFYNKCKVDDYSFEILYNRVQEKYKDKELKISALYERDRNGKHLFLEPNGTLMVIADSKEILIGNCKQPSEELLNIISFSLNPENVNTNFKNSF